MRPCLIEILHPLHKRDVQCGICRSLLWSQCGICRSQVAPNSCFVHAKLCRDLTLPGTITAPPLASGPAVQGIGGKCAILIRPPRQPIRFAAGSISAESPVAEATTATSAPGQ